MGNTDTLRRRCRVVNPVTSANDRFIAESVGDSNTRSEVVLIRKNRAAPQTVLIGKNVAKVDDAGIQILERCGRRNHKSTQLSCGGIDVVRIEIRNQVIGINEGNYEFVAQSEIHSQPGINFPGILNEVTVLPVAYVQVCRANHFHSSSYFLQRALRPKMADLFRHVKERGLTTSLDTNDDPDEEWSEDLFPLLKYVDVLLPNEREACKISRKQNVEAAAKFLSGVVPLVVIKRGSQGGLAQSGSDIFSAPPLSSIFVDAVGAGDSFDAGFIHQYIRGAKTEDCLKFGNVAGALSVTRTGGTEAFRDESHREQFLNLNWQ
jgi:hypothetical protein